MDEEQEHKERPRLRIVDKRVSSRPESDPAAPAADSDSAGSGADTSPLRSDSPRPADAGLRNSPGGRSAPLPASSSVGDQNQPAGEVWTPQQEEEMRAMARHIAETPSLEWVINTAVTLANVAGTKLDLGAIADAQLAIDALGALIDGLGARLGTAEAALRQTLAQLQMAYAEQVTPPPIS